MAQDPVLSLVVLLQVAILLRCVVLAWRDDSKALDKLRWEFKRDVLGRAQRGDGPDWVRYMDEADRVHERRVDRLRVLSTVALVVGIGGTMGALAFRLLGLGIGGAAGAEGQPTDELGALVAAVGPALLASLSGVLNNILITLGLFRLSDRRFEQTLGDFREALQKCSDDNPPRGTLAETVTEQQERFVEAVREQLGQAFREAVRSFPEAFARLDESVQHLGGAAREQSQSMLAAAARLQEGADGLTGAMSRIAPLAELLNTASTELRAVPDALRRTLDETRQAWAEEMRVDQEAFIGGVRQVLGDQHALLDSTRNAFDEWESARRDEAQQQLARWRESVELVQQAAAELVKAAEGLPAAFTQGVDQVADTLGKEFGLKAQQHVGDLTREIREGHRSLGAQIEESTRALQNRFLNDTARVVGESAEEVHRRVGGPLLDSLDAVRRGIDEALTTLPENARSFAHSLSAADEKLKQSIEKLKQSAEELRRVAKLSEGFQTRLTDTLQNATARGFEPLQDQLGALLADLRRSHDLMVELVRRRRAAANKGRRWIPRWVGRLFRRR